MPFKRVAELVRRAARDTGVFDALKNDPARLRSALKLTDAHLEALNSATAFPPPKVLAKVAKVTQPAVRAAKPRSEALAAPGAGLLGDGGSLLPPEGSGQFTGATTGFAPSAPPPVIAPPAPGVRPPLGPPVSPPSVVPPRLGPVSRPPQSPPINGWPPVTPPWTQPGPPLGPPQVPETSPQLPSVHGCDCCAIAGIVSVVATTATTAITAITA